jgi:ParB family chromosome partitioning protein
VQKVARKQITNSKDLRKLRIILRDPVAKAHFVEDEASIDSAMLRVAHKAPAETGLAGQLDAAMNVIRHMPWTQIDELKGNPDILARLTEAEQLLASLRNNLTS